MASTASRTVIGRNILRGVSYSTYVQLRDDPRNGRVGMTYHDGTLEIMSPQARHELPSRRLGLVIYEVTAAFDIPCTGVRSTTFRRGGEEVARGLGKEPDESFYLANEARILGKATIDLDAGDPPPDLWIEVDNRASSRGKLPLYAGLGVPEVWRYRVRRKSLWFGRLAGGSYTPIGRSLALPMLTPALVLEALALGEGLSETTWGRRVRAWIAERLT